MFFYNKIEVSRSALILLKLILILTIGLHARFPTFRNPQAVQKPWHIFDSPAAYYLQKRQAIPPRQLQRPIESPIQKQPIVPRYPYEQLRLRRQLELTIPAEPIPIQMKNLPEVPRFPRSPQKGFPKKHPAPLGRSCCLNADYCVPWACPPPAATWKKLVTNKPYVNTDTPESRSVGRFGGSGCVCNDLHFCPPGCTYDPTNFDRDEIGTWRGTTKTWSWYNIKWCSNICELPVVPIVSIQIVSIKIAHLET